MGLAGAGVDMKHLAISLACLFLVAAALIVAVHSNNQALQSTKAHVAAVGNQVQQTVATNQKLHSQLRASSVEVTTLQTQCQVGLKDYNLLSSTERLKAVAPVCTVPADTAIAK